MYHIYIYIYIIYLYVYSTACVITVALMTCSGVPFTIMGLSGIPITLVGVENAEERLLLVLVGDDVASMTERQSKTKQICCECLQFKLRLSPPPG